MNYNFGTPKTTAGFTLSAGTPTAANTGLNFAGGDNKSVSTAQTGGKSTFGTDAVQTPISGFQLPTQAFSATPTLSFGSQPTTPNVSFGVSSASNTSALAGYSLGSSTVAQSSTPATTTAPALSLATPATVTPNFNLGSAITTSSSTGFSLGGISSTGLSLGTPAATTTSAATGFTLGKVATIAAVTTTTAAPTTGGLTFTPASTAAPGIALTNVSVSSAASGAPAGGFTFSQLEEALNKWTLELEDQGKMFINQALQLNAWDRLVIANGEKILTLNCGIEKVKQQQLQLDHELDFVKAQQRELEECIIPLEKELKDIPVTDQDRNHTYQMAENMDTQLKQMSEDLKEIIEHLNESNKTEDTTDPVAQIGRILNAHMNSLEWIDRNTAQISTFLDQITKMHDMHRRDNERSFHLTYE